MSLSLFGIILGLVLLMFLAYKGYPSSGSPLSAPWWWPCSAAMPSWTPTLATI